MLLERPTRATGMQEAKAKPAKLASKDTAWVQPAQKAQIMTLQIN